jgi:flagellar export protein FliJ
VDEFSKKLKRVKPLIRAREAQLNSEAIILANVRNEKKLAMQELRKFQTLYMSGVEELNRERQSPQRDKLNTLEQSVDYAKAQWYQCLKTLREVEQKERAQIAQLFIAERNLKSVEKLEDRYGEQVQLHEKSVEQKQLDDVATRKFSQRK